MAHLKMICSKSSGQDKKTRDKILLLLGWRKTFQVSILISNVNHFCTLWSEAEHGAWNEKPYHEILLKDRTQKLGTVNKIEKIAPRKPCDSSGARREILPGSILVATEKLLGVHQFAGSKILIVKANQTTGFQGLIINKLIPWDIITPLEEGLDPLIDAPLSYGGPLFTPGRPLFSLTRQSVGDEHPEILPNIYFLDQLATVNLRQNLKVQGRSVTDYWFFMGYSAWGWNQLFDEIDDGSWDIINGTAQQFDWPMKRWHFGLLLGRELEPCLGKGTISILFIRVLQSNLLNPSLLHHQLQELLVTISNMTST
ncbi:hypothetical protein L1987_41716 [Smallanthus sonchifolius]|uniref:Uncharacterized protein n=1 Tax=Smallanthus sonchifolius TaxID=185202 RepID=A0ACB9GV54_9ASTR|nr:hypothetical protein L1987_41716 [Smallanthus sonchifolius]